jgi:mannosyltransferase OCH1-like enzyme
VIEKKINYIWFGGKNKTKEIIKCIDSWKKYLPDYEIIEWNENNFNMSEEIKNNKFFRECLKKKLWAFMSDYARIKILYKYGGIYMDTDIEIIKNIDNILENDFFAGYEDEGTINFAILGCVPKHEIMKKLLEFYETEIWKSNMFLIPSILTELLKRQYGNNLNNIKGLRIYSQDYFYPYRYNEKFTKTCITSNTCAIHWWSKTWGKNINVYYLKYKHYSFIVRNIKYLCKILNVYFYKKKETIDVE